MLQYCGKQSNNPYYIRAIDTNVYSLEEINYFIYNHINLVYREFFCSELFDYIENELGRADMARELREMEAADAKISDFIRYILGESFYYSANDLAQISDLITNINTMTRPKRLTLEADSLFEEGSYAKALAIYEEILSKMEEDGESNSFYGRIAFAAGVCFAKMFMCRNANSYFAYAYELYPEPTYAKACVYMSIAIGDDEELLRTIIRYKVSDDALTTIRKRVNSIRHEIEINSVTEEFEQRLDQRGEAEKIISEWKKEYYGMKE